MTCVSGLCEFIFSEEVDFDGITLLYLNTHALSISISCILYILSYLFVVYISIVRSSIITSTSPEIVHDRNVYPFRHTEN